MAPGGAEHRSSVLRRLHDHDRHVDLCHNHHVYPLLRRGGALREHPKLDHEPTVLIEPQFSTLHAEKKRQWVHVSINTLWNISEKSLSSQSLALTTKHRTTNIVIFISTSPEKLIELAANKTEKQKKKL